VGIQKVKRLFVCDSCGRSSAQWSGKCVSCGSWGSVSERPARGSSASGPPDIASLLDAHDTEEHRISTGLAGFDRVVGGGLVPGSVVLLAGAPGIGKSTLLLQLASRLAGAGRSCLLASGEESRSQVAGRARRLGIDGASIGYVAGRDLRDVLEAARAGRPSLLIVDSIQTIRDVESEAAPGGVAQVRGCADALISLAKEQGVTALLAGHVTKDGDLAGPRTLEHAVDAVLTFDGDPRSGLRILVGGKNRFGPEGEVAWFEMGSAGLVEVDPATRVTEGRPEPGCATALAVAGRRALAIEVQALAVPTDGPPRRHVSGLDLRRFHIVAAVTDRALSRGLGRCEIYGSSSGGFRVEDPGTDLAVAVAIASAATGRAPPTGTAFVGEVGLTGAVRHVAGLEQRLAAAAAAGLGTVLVPASADQRDPGPGIRLVTVRHVRDALARLGVADPVRRERRETIGQRV
jgi:DNA repair protein RadA/Sms